MTAAMLFAFCVSALAGIGGDPSARGPRDDVPKTIESRFKELATEYDSKLQTWHLANLKAKTPDERQRAVKELRPDDKVYAQRFLALAQEDPKAPTALDALGRVLNCSRDDAADAAIDQLGRDWTTNPRIAGVIHPISTSVSTKAEGLLRDIIAKNTDRNAVGPAVLALAMRLDSYAGFAMQRNQSPEKAKLLEKYYRKEQLDQIFKVDPITLLKEAEALFERARKEFADVKLSPRARQTIGEYTSTRLNRLNALAPGKPAPEIDGEDIDGKRFKLSEYRGKVVVLVFWASWCAPCLQQVPHELALMKRMQAKPFVLLGVNLDHNEELMRRAISEHGIIWRNWRGGSDDRIKGRYGIQAIPFVLVIDSEGIIRAKDFQFEALERTIEGLLQRAAK